MQTQGSLQESSLASLLQTMQTERATGALALESQSETASLYFLFGHLFHAQSGQAQGEAVVVDALGWHDGHYRFDPRAKLPPEETIKASPAELIAAAERRAPAAGEQEGWSDQPEYPEPEPVASGDAPGAEAYSAAPEPGYGAEQAWEPEAPAYPSWEYRAAEPAPEPTASYPGFAERAPYPAPAPGLGVRVPEPAPAAHGEPFAGYPQPTRAPEPVPGEAPRPVGVQGAVAAPAVDIFYPLPAGRAQYEGLKSAFVDFPKLLRTLRGDQHTGYVRLTGSGFSGALLFREGELLDALSSEAEGRSGEGAFRAIQRAMEAGAGTLDVIDLPADTVDALARLLAAPLLYTGLLGRFVNFEGLLAHLADERADGAVIVMGSGDVGIILLAQGQILGAYTDSNPGLSSAATGVSSIAGEKGARIEVKRGAGAASPLDVERALSQIR